MCRREGACALGMLLLRTYGDVLDEMDDERGAGGDVESKVHVNRT